MKSVSKLLLASAVAMMAIAISVAPSEAAKKKKKAAKPEACAVGMLCSTACTSGICRVNVCGADRKWYQALFTPVCFTPGCPPACK